MPSRLETGRRSSRHRPRRGRLLCSGCGQWLTAVQLALAGTEQSLSHANRYGREGPLYEAQRSQPAALPRRRAPLSAQLWRECVLPTLKRHPSLTFECRKAAVQAPAQARKRAPSGEDACTQPPQRHCRQVDFAELPRPATGGPSSESHEELSAFIDHIDEDVPLLQRINVARRRWLADPCHLRVHHPGATATYGHTSVQFDAAKRLCRRLRLAHPKSPRHSPNLSRDTCLVTRL